MSLSRWPAWSWTRIDWVLRLPRLGEIIRSDPTGAERMYVLHLSFPPAPPEASVIAVYRSPNILTPGRTSLPIKSQVAAGGDNGPGSRVPDRPCLRLVRRWSDFAVNRIHRWSLIRNQSLSLESWAHFDNAIKCIQCSINASLGGLLFGGRPLPSCGPSGSVIAKH